METVISIFKQLMQTSSAIDKSLIVTANAENRAFVESLVFLVDKNVVTGFSKAKLHKNVEIAVIDVPESWSECMRYVKDHNTGSDIDIAVIQAFISAQSDEHRWFYEGMVTKSLRIGMTVKSINKAIPGLINVYNTQQGYLLDDKHMPADGEVFVLSEKLNGINGGFLDGKCISRQGKPIHGMGHIVREINMLGLGDMYFNGELIRINHDNLPDEENFRLTYAMTNTLDDNDKTDIELVFYEVLTKEEFLAGVSNETYLHRFEQYKKIQSRIEELGLKHIRFVPVYYVGSDKSQIQVWLNYADNHGKEGIMLNKDTCWENRRNYGLLKVKTFKHADLRCKAVQEGDGKNKGRLGNIVVDYKGNDLGVGGGFTDEQRVYYWAHPEEIIGKIIMVKYKTESNNKDGGMSLQFPTFVCIRDDKDEVSYN